MSHFDHPKKKTDVLPAARAAAEGIQQMKKSGYGEIQSLQEWHEEIR